MGIKDNLEKAAELFGNSHEPECVVMAEESKRKVIGEFDISKHEFLESDIQGVEVVGEMLRLHLMSQDLPYVEHSKTDAIAIAKALGVTAEDLK